MNRFRHLSMFYSTTHCRRFVLLTLGLLASSSTVFAQTFPYTAYISGEQVYVRSGPGQRHYPTNQLARGVAVEVYRHDAEGWCAIRPPQNSYSLLPSHEVRAVGPGVVEVVGENVVSRVGSTLSASRTAVQVLLPRGEQLQVLSTSTSDDPRWVRIAAPAGEFRWIAASSLSRQQPVAVAPVPVKQEMDLSDAGPASGLGWVRRSDRLTKVKSGNVTSMASAITVQPKLAQQSKAFQHLQHQAAATANNPQQINVVAGSPADLQLTQYSAPALLAGNSPAAVRAQTSGAPQPRIQFDGSTAVASAAKVASVEELELRLSQAVVVSPQQWQLSPLQAAANALLAETKSPPVRAQLREVLERIARFQEVQNRYRNPSPVVTPGRDPFVTTASTSTLSADATVSTLEPLGSTTSDSLDEISSALQSREELKGLTGMSSAIRDRVREDLDGARSTPASRKTSARSSSITPTRSNRTTASGSKGLYAATGTLKPVRSKRKKSPKFALVDERGKVISFLSSTPNLDLQRYVGQRIGVNGKQGYMPEYRLAHVTVGRVTPLVRTARR